ncbi:MAG: hypothetical protein J6K88_02105 [Oscillospiraceae bacterium]|nr:hypothetical protein [Oscillospiraceae bacterium]
MLNIYEKLQNALIEIRYLYSENYFDELRFQIIKSNIENIREVLENESNKNNYILIYCIDNLFKIINENNIQKTFDFADMIHNMPEICMGKRNLKSFQAEIKTFNKKHNSKYFMGYFKIFS